MIRLGLGQYGKTRSGSGNHPTLYQEGYTSWKLIRATRGHTCGSAKPLAIKKSLFKGITNLSSGGCRSRSFRKKGITAIGWICVFMSRGIPGLIDKVCSGWELLHLIVDAVTCFWNGLCLFCACWQTIFSHLSIAVLTQCGAKISNLSTSSV